MPEKWVVVGSRQFTGSQKPEERAGLSRELAAYQKTDDRNQKAVRGREYAGFVGRGAVYIRSLPVRHRATAL